MASAVTLEELIALNQEIASLARAGVPLEAGLREIAYDQPARLGELSVALSEHMQRGQSLAEAIQTEGERIPRVYGKVVEAGQRAGRLPAALESLTSFASEVLELRRRIGLAMLYPIIVVALAYGLFLVFILEFARRIRETYDVIGLNIPPSLKLLGRIGESTMSWAWIPPVVLLLLFHLWRRSAGVGGLRLVGNSTPLRWIPGVSRIMDNLQAANFADLLALMVDHGVPLEEGITLTADSIGEKRFIDAAATLVEAERRGDPISEVHTARAIPPYLRWLIAGKNLPVDLARGLRAAAAMYRRRAADQLAYLRLLFPIVTAVVIGGGATLLYALTMFLPLINTLNDMALEVSPY